jgi:hypothetical protein
MIKIVIHKCEIPSIKKLFPGIEIREVIGGLLNTIKVHSVELDHISKRKWDEYNELHETIARKSFHRQLTNQ